MGLAVLINGESGAGKSASLACISQDFLLKAISMLSK